MFGRKKIIVVDDIPDVLYLLRSVLEFQGFDVVSYQNPEDAKNALESEKYDLLITDYYMGQLNGLELIKHVRENIGNKEIKLILLTIKNMTEDEKRQLVHYNTILLEKPFSPNDLTQKVQSILS